MSPEIRCGQADCMFGDPEWCITQMKSIVQTFIQGKQLAGGIPAGKKVLYRDR